jgi:chloride channel 3/4/5
MRSIHSRKGTRHRILAMFDDATGWIVAALIGTLTACVAYLVDVAEATVSDWKLGYCKRNPLLNFDSCCETASSPSLAGNHSPITTTNEPTCEAFHKWSNNYAPSFAIYVAFALAFGIISSSATMLTKRSLPAASPGTGDKDQYNGPPAPVATGKTMYMAAGSGIPEIKTILSGFVIPNFLDFKVLFVKGFGAVFAVATGMCLGKEGPFVHISTCVGFLVADRFAKYRDNGRKMREMLSVACAAGLSVGMLCFYLFARRNTSRVSIGLTLLPQLSVPPSAAFSSPTKKSAPTSPDESSGAPFSALSAPPWC